MTESLDKEEERWVDVKDFPNYQISSFGRIRSNHSGSWFYMAFRYDKDGYVEINLRNKGITKYARIHRLVCAAFNGEPPNEEMSVVNHIDGLKDNNYWKNLEWCTPQYNLRHGISIGTNPYGGAIEILVHCVEDKTVDTFKYQADVIKKFNLNKTNLNLLLNRYPNLSLIYDNKTYLLEPVIIDETKAGCGAKSIRIRDHVENIEFSVSSLKLGSLKTGVDQGTIKTYCDNSKMVAGYSFKLNDDIKGFEYHDKEEALVSRYRYFNKIPAYYVTIKIKDKQTNEILEFQSKTALQMFLKTTKKILRRILKKTPHDIFGKYELVEMNRHQ